MILANKVKFNNYERLWLTTTVITILLNPFVVRVSGIISYGIYLSLLLILVYMIAKGKICIRKNWFWSCTCFLILGIISSFIGESVIGGTLQEIHKHFFFSLFMILALSVRWDMYLSGKFVDYFIATVCFMGVVATLYALVFQGKYIPSILLENSYAGYTAFRSFFYQRNVFACMLFYASCASIFLYLKKNSKIYLILVFIFGIEIYLASSKASLLAWGLMLCMFFVKKTKNKWLTVIFAVLFGSLAVYYFIIPLISRMQHVAYIGISSSEIRLNQWMLGIEKLSAEKAWVTGFGMGAEANFLYHYFSYGSFHNVYLDLLFQGGLIKLGFYIITIVFCMKSILQIKDYDLKWMLTTAFISFWAYSFVESGAMMFSISYFSFLSTVMFCIVPQVKKYGV